MDIVIDYFRRIAAYPLWVVAIELFLIGLVVYWVVDFLEGTRGERLFRGIIIILIAGVLVLNPMVERFGFERLEHLFRGFLIAVLIIAVAAFQPEIRRVVLRIGQGRFLRGSSQELEEIVSAATDLSATKTGAIIVIEKKIALGEFIETGVQMDARVTSELLKTIFWPGTPLHDMAVIIRGDRVVAARVQLPLAEADSVEGVELGSRHRAALGITSGSDAGAVLVSEETGIISFASEGKLYRNLDDSGLRKLLASSMDEVAPVIARLRGGVVRSSTGKA